MDMAFLFLGISSSVLLNDFLNLFKFHLQNIQQLLLGYFLYLYIFFIYKNLNMNNDHILNIAAKLKIIMQDKSMKNLPWVIWPVKFLIY